MSLSLFLSRATKMWVSTCPAHFNSSAAGKSAKRIDRHEGALGTLEGFPGALLVWKDLAGHRADSPRNWITACGKSLSLEPRQTSVLVLTPPLPKCMTLIECDCLLHVLLCDVQVMIVTAIPQGCVRIQGDSSGKCSAEHLAGIK